jgi:hypothetical protein
MATKSDYKPWAHPKGSSYASLVKQGMEIVCPPGVPAPVSTHDYMNRELPAIPGVTQKQNNRGQLKNMIAMHLDTSQTTEASPSYRFSSERPRPLPAKGQSSLNTIPRLMLSPPTPLLSEKSSQKILQLTGFDPGLQRAIFIPQQQHHPILPEAPGSSSVYSQPGKEYGGQEETAKNNRVIPAGTGEIYPGSDLQSGRIKQQSLGAAVKARDSSSPTKYSGPKVNQEHSTKIFTASGPNELILKGFIDQERSQHKKGFGGLGHDVDGKHTPVRNDADRALVPLPLAVCAKAKKPVHLKIERSSFFAEVRDSMAWGIREVTSPTRSKYLTTNPVKKASLQVPPAGTPKRKQNFSTGKHPLKSPFPFPRIRNLAESAEGDDMRDRGMPAATRQSSVWNSSPTSKSIIRNSARAPDGPDTPMPVKTGFMSILSHMNETTQSEDSSKAKQKLKGKTTAERRRESLKKKIVVVGISDQSPGTLLSR